MSKRIGLICGHGYSDPGAVANGYKESERVRYIAGFIKDELNKITNVTCDIVNGSNDVFQDENIEIISKDYDEIIELHLNSASSSATGTETLIFLDGVDKIDKATLIANSKFWSNRGLKDGAWLRNAVYCLCSYRLVEFCFISNINDINIFNKKTKEIAEEFAKEIAVAIGEKYMDDNKIKFSVYKIKTGNYYKDIDGLDVDENGKHIFYVYSNSYYPDGSVKKSQSSRKNIYYRPVEIKGDNIYISESKTNVYLYKDVGLTKKVMVNNYHKHIPPKNEFIAEYVGSVVK